MSSLAVNGISLGFYPDEGDAGGYKSYLSDLNSALTRSWPSSCSPSSPPLISTVGWYAQTYPHEEFNGFQFMPLVDDIKTAYLQHPTSYIYEASVMPFQSWTGYTSQDSTKAAEVAKVMQAMLDRSRCGDVFGIAEIRLRFGHEVNYYIKSGLYPPPTNAQDPGGDYRAAFEQVALACRSLDPEYRQRIKMFWCPNIASVPGAAADQEYKTYLPSLEYVDYVGIDYYCPAAGCLDASDFIRKMRKVHDRYATESRPFILGETGLHFDVDGQDMEHVKLKWLSVITSKEVKRSLRWMVGVSWFNYEKDRDYRLVWVREGEERSNEGFVEWLVERLGRRGVAQGGAEEGKKVKRFFKTLFS